MAAATYAFADTLPAFDFSDATLYALLAMLPLMPQRHYAAIIYARYDY